MPAELHADLFSPVLFFAAFFSSFSLAQLARFYLVYSCAFATFFSL
jgi:hypothetical protein